MTLIRPVWLKKIKARTSYFFSIRNCFLNANGVLNNGNLTSFNNFNEALLKTAERIPFFSAEIRKENADNILKNYKEILKEYMKFKEIMGD
ncbi:MAG: hypothetical protein FWE18_00005 [Alphaproteobacteria bacterium]|nr:hypothetical protein [Alphaproteobacteria bacterium]